MGAWGTVIFSDDTAHDIRSEYSRLLSVGASDEETTSIIFHARKKKGKKTNCNNISLETW